MRILLSILLLTAYASATIFEHTNRFKNIIKRKNIQLGARQETETVTVTETINTVETITVLVGAEKIAAKSVISKPTSSSDATAAEVTKKPKQFNETEVKNSKTLLTIRTGAKEFETTVFNKGIVKNGIALGFLPDDGSGGGKKQSLSQIESSLKIKSAAQGWYSQCYGGRLYDGNQFRWRKDEILKNGGVFQPAIMPINGWWGLKWNDNRQAVAICKSLKEFTDEGLEVWLRFAHEINWYLRDGTYIGNIDDFKEAWAVVADACKKEAPLVKMWYTPNIANLDEYSRFYPDDPNTVDLIGIDYYPKTEEELDFVKVMKPFHDKYTNERTKFAIGEIGLAREFNMETRLKWLKNMMSEETKAAMPNYIQISWFNYHKGHDFRIGAANEDWKVRDWLNS